MLFKQKPWSLQFNVTFWDATKKKTWAKDSSI